MLASLKDMELWGKEILPESLIVTGLGIIAVSELAPLKPMRELGRYSGTAVAIGGVVLGISEQALFDNKRV